MRELLAFRIEFEKSNRLKMFMGIVLAVASVFCWQFWFPSDTMALILGIVFAVLLLTAGMLKCCAETEKASQFLNVLWGICSVIAVIFIALPSRYTIEGLYMIALNLLCACIIVCFFMLITASWRQAINLTVFALALLIGLNQIVFAFRGKEFGVGDIKAAKTALSVVDQYRFYMSKRFLFLCCGFVLAVFSQFVLPAFSKQKRKRIYTRCVALFSIVALIQLLYLGSAEYAVTSWSDAGTSVNGYLLNFYLGIRDAKVKAPSGYDSETIQKYTAIYQTENRQIQEFPNVIVIMNESFSDLSVYGTELTTDIPITPYIDTLSENTIKGYALTSIHGGQTPNTEYEFLTGHSMAWLPSGSVAYQQYIFEETFSLAWVLESYGYSSFGTHPYHATGWSRSTVYPYLGLKSSTFLDDYSKENMLRGFVSDQEMFEYVLDCLSEDRDGQPLFLMGITMQNHGGYLYEGDDFSETVHLTGLSRGYPAANQYLSLLNETDRAVEYLLTQLQDYPEDTIVVFFGDHQPNLGMEIVEELHGSPLNTLDERMLQYTVPFFIWANYDIEEATVPCTSINYLSRYLLECAGLELPTYYRILKDIEETIPAINAFGYYSLEKGRYATFDEAEGKEAEMLEMYENIQYNNMFDEENRNYELFGQYITP